MAIEIYPVVPTGIGKPDYTREISLGQVRPGIALKFNQQMVEFVYSATDLVWGSPFPWVRRPIPPGGACTAASPIVLTDAAAAWPVNGLVGMTAHNITDGSMGIITANTAITATVNLAGGIANAWAIADAYLFGVHLINLATGMPMPYLVPAGSNLALIEQRFNFDMRIEAWIYADGWLVAMPAGSNAGLMISQGDIAQFATILVDPTLALPHQIDYEVINRGAGYAIGAITITTILERYF